MLVVVIVAVVAVVKVLLWAGVVVDIVVELLVIDEAVIEPFCNVVTGVVLVLDFIVTVSYFGNVFEVLSVDIGVEVLAGVDVNVS